MTRIAAGGIFHETNTYAAPTPIEEFAVSRGAEIRTVYRGTRTYLGGVLDACDRNAAVELVPVLYAEATPSGTITAECWQRLSEEFVAGIVSARPDAVVLVLHGAGVAEGAESVEDALCLRLRQELGPEVPIVATLDLHGNLSEDLASACDALFPVRLNPHTDQYEQGQLAVEAAVPGQRGRLHTVVEKLPLAFPPIPTSDPLLAELNERCLELEQEPGVAAVRVMHGFPYADVPHLGASVVAVAESRPRARELARDVAGRMWARREELRVDAFPPREAVVRAMAAPAPVVINEFCDNTGAGAPGDGTHLLRALIESGARACFSHLFDPAVVAAAHAAGVGAEIRVRLGAWHDDQLSGSPIDVRARVLTLGTGSFPVKSAMGGGEPIDLGRLCALRVGQVDVVVSSGRRQTLDDRWFIRAGIDISEYPIIAVKSSQHFRAYFTVLAATIITSDSSGLSAADVTAFPRQRLSSALWPLEPRADYRLATA